MSRQLKQALAWATITVTVLSGCHPTQPFYISEDGDLSHFLDVATDIEFPDVHQPSLDEVCQTRAPLTISNPSYDSIWELSLEEAISIAMHNSKVIRTFGPVTQFGQISATPPSRLAAAPINVATVYDPAIADTGTAGVEQALANFDTIFNLTSNYATTYRPQNFTGLNAQFPAISRQDQITVNAELQKQAATGTQLFLRHVNIYTRNPSQPGARPLESDWFTAAEAELRQPLLRGRGTQVNRIPVVLARINTDQRLADFEFAVREQVANIEQAYWELYFFYRNLEATKIGRDSALVTWKKVYALFQTSGPGGEADKEAQAREQYFFFRVQLETALKDLYRSENQLRYLLGITATDGRLIRPSDIPTVAKVTFGWNESHCETLIRSVELRRQKWSIKQRELELIAARNQLLPQFDIVALYRFLGVGDNYDSFNRNPTNFVGGSLAPGSTAIDSLTDGEFKEGQLGFQLNVPIGFRRELAGVRNGELSLARERARLEDMELTVSHELTAALQELDAQYMIMQSNLNRRTAAEAQVDAVEEAYKAGTVLLDLLLDSQRRRADAEISFYQSVVEYNLAIMRVHFRKGSLLEYDSVVLAEGPWPGKAYEDAYQKARRRDASHYLDYGYSRPNVASLGPVDQMTGDGDCESGDCYTSQGEDGQVPTDQSEIRFEELPSSPESIQESIEAPRAMEPTRANPRERPQPADTPEDTEAWLRRTRSQLGRRQPTTGRRRPRGSTTQNPARGRTEAARFTERQSAERPATERRATERRATAEPSIDFLGALESTTLDVLEDHVIESKRSPLSGEPLSGEPLSGEPSSRELSKDSRASVAREVAPVSAVSASMRVADRPTEWRLSDARQAIESVGANAAPKPIETITPESIGRTRTLRFSTRANPLSSSRAIETAEPAAPAFVATFTDGPATSNKTRPSADGEVVRISSRTGFRTVNRSDDEAGNRTVDLKWKE